MSCTHSHTSASMNSNVILWITLMSKSFSSSVNMVCLKFQNVYPYKETRWLWLISKYSRQVGSVKPDHENVAEVK